MATRVASLYAEIGADTSKLNKGLQDTRGQLTKTKGDFGALAAKALALGGTFTAAGIAVKKAFDWGKQGAAVIQTTESFDMLIEKIGASTTALDEMRRATNYTIDDITLMKGVLTLTAGTSDEYARTLTGIAPKLAEIAKASNKLNPLLGDTNFMFESLTTAAKRQSIMIADNLGLTIKMDSAVKELHPSLVGLAKDYDSLTDQQKFLNEMLWQGDKLIDQVGGTAESSADKFLQLEATLKSLGDTFKTKLTPSVATAAGTLDLLLNWNDRLMAGLTEHREEINKSSMSYDDYVTEMKRAAEVAGYLVDEQGNLVKQTGWYNDEFGNQVGITTELVKENYILSRSQKELAEIFRNAAFDTSLYTASLGELETSAEDLADVFEERMLRLNEEAADAIRRAQEQLVKPKQIALDLEITDINISSKISGTIDQLLYEAVGGDEIGRAFRDIMRGLEYSPEISSDVAQEYLQKLFVIDQQALVDANQQSIKDAAAAIAEEFGVSLGEATTMLGEAGTVGDLMDAFKVLEEAPGKIAERTNMLEMAEGIKLSGENAGEASGNIDEWAKSLEGAADPMGDINEETKNYIDSTPEAITIAGEFGEVMVQLGDDVGEVIPPLGKVITLQDALQDKHVEWTVNISVTGDSIPGFSGPKIQGGQYEADGGGQHGADFIVPPGYPGDSFLFGLSSGEHVSVTPRGKGGGGNVIYQIQQNNYTRESAAMGNALIAMLESSRLNNAMGG